MTWGFECQRVTLLQRMQKYPVPPHNTEALLQQYKAVDTRNSPRGNGTVVPIPLWTVRINRNLTLLYLEETISWAPSALLTPPPACPNEDGMKNEQSKQR